MGEAVGKRGGMMYPGPSKAAEAIVAVFVPPACREEILGDLHERYRSPRQYGVDALCTVPLVIISRIRRTADPQVLLIQAFALYVSFLGAAWLEDGALLRERWGLLRLAIPAGAALLGLILEDTYANPGRRSPLRLVRGPVLGVGLALVSQSVFWAGDQALAVPRWIMFYGCALSLLLSSAVRMLFPPATDQLQGANAPAFWLKQASGTAGNPQGIILVLKGAVAIVAVVIVGTWMADLSPSLRPRLGVPFLLVVLVVAYQVLKRG
jgi:hypothetical protein